MLVSTIASPQKLAGLGQLLSANIHYQSSPEKLIQDTLRLQEGVLDNSGALVISTGKFTGRSPRDKFIVRDSVTSSAVDWNNFNQPLSESYFDIICMRMNQYLRRSSELWVRDCKACADERYSINIRIVAEKPWSALFAHNMFLRLSGEELRDFEAEWQVFVAPGLELDPAECGTNSKNASVISFEHKMILVAGSGYTGEIKKSIFTVLNFLLPETRKVLSMHCSANMGEAGDTALFFGLSGTGKTTLSADPKRQLIGDDEHGWTSDNVFNFEGGCYAKVINLSETSEPDIFAAIKPGALLENTRFHPGTTTVNYQDTSITENTRVSYPINFIKNSRRPSTGNIPANIFFLTCDASGILPPISRLTPAQAMYHFISGYTAKIQGTETGITEPVATFSACFGAPFIPLHPSKYASMLGEKLKRYRSTVWLINTGWTGGAYGKGSRIKLGFTRSMINAVITGELKNVRCDTHPVFGMDIPVSCPGVPSNLLYPRDTWENKEEYDAGAINLAKKFLKNFEKYSEGTASEILDAAPVIKGL